MIDSIKLVRLKFIVFLLFFYGFNVNSQTLSTEEDFFWGNSREDILKRFKEIPSDEPYSLKYKNLEMLGMKCNISYYFYNNKLWRKRISFYSTSDATLTLIREFLMTSYPTQVNYNAWRTNITDILLKQDDYFTYIFYENRAVASNIKKEQIRLYLKDL